MDRWYWTPSNLAAGEEAKTTASSIRLYDGDKKTQFSDGHITLTNYRILWRHESQSSSLGLDLANVVFVEEESGGFMSSAKILLHLTSQTNSQKSGPVSASSYTFVKLSFKHGGMSTFNMTLQNVLQNKDWERSLIVSPNASSKNVIRAGIVGIERDIEAKQKETDKNISKAFEDLQNLMGLAKDMVTLSRNIANKIKEQTGEVSTDEVTQLRSYLLSMGIGIDDPVTKEAVGSTTEYHSLLAREVSQALEQAVKDVGGVMLMSEVYCRINRARGLQLLSPEDVLNACCVMASLQLPLCLHSFQSGVQVLQLATLDEIRVSEETKKCLEMHQKEGISAAEFSKVSGVPLLLAQERLLQCERMAMAVRDDSSEGLRFFPNLFHVKLQLV